MERESGANKQLSDKIGGKSYRDVFENSFRKAKYNEIFAKNRAIFMQSSGENLEVSSSNGGHPAH